MAVFLLVVPVGAVASPIRIAAPFSGATALVHNWSKLVKVAYNTRCTAEWAVAPSASTATGNVRTTTNVSALGWWGAAGCRIWDHTVMGFFGSSIRAGSTSHHVIGYLWNLSWAARARGTGYVSVFVVGNLYDNTSKSWVFSSNQSLAVFHLGTISVTNHAPTQSSGTGRVFNLTLGVSLTSGHQYLFSTAIETVLTAFGIERPGPSYNYVVHHHGGAWVEIGTPAGSSRLQSITVT